MRSESTSQEPINKLEWNTNYSVGYTAMDKQHQILFDVINHLVSAQETPLTHEELRTILNELQTYSKAHFEAEEKLMKLMDYSELDAHQRAHEVYREKIIQFGVRLDEGVPDVDLKLLHFLYSWWNDHVQVIDKGYARQS